VLDRHADVSVVLLRAHDGRNRDTALRGDSRGSMRQIERAVTTLLDSGGRSVCGDSGLGLRQLSAMASAAGDGARRDGASAVPDLATLAGVAAAACADDATWALEHVLASQARARSETLAGDLAPKLSVLDAPLTAAALPRAARWASRRVAARYVARGGAIVADYDFDDDASRAEVAAAMRRGESVGIDDALDAACAK
jgi:hypothetical protein